MSSTQRVVHSDPDILGGTPVFIGTRVPIQTLLDYLEAGDSLDEFLDHFPSVSRDQAIAALELVSREDWEAVQETLYLTSLPSFVESIKGIENNPIEEWTNAKDIGLL